MYEYRAIPIKVHDGDTFTADVDLGFFVHHIMPVRMEGLFAPELNEKGGAAAKVALTELLFPEEQGFGVHAADLLLRSSKAGERLSYERWVFRVFRVEKGGSLTDLNESMALAGFQGQGRGA